MPLEPIPPPADGSLTAVDIAGADKIKATRMLLCDASGKLRFIRYTAEERQQAGRPLSAAELKFARTASRFLARRQEIGAAAAVPPPDFDRALETDLALTRMARATGEVEATSAIGELLLKARLTTENDRVFLYAGSAELLPSERDALRTYLASADLIYERQLQLVKARKDRSSKRKGKQEEDLLRSNEESERLRKRGLLQDGTK